MVLRASKKKMSKRDIRRNSKDTRSRSQGGKVLREGVLTMPTLKWGKVDTEKSLPDLSIEREQFGQPEPNCGG